MTPAQLQQARNAAADIAYPDEGFHGWQRRPGWGNGIKAQRIAQHVKPGKSRSPAAWRNWTIEDSIRIITAPPKPPPPPKTSTCQHCGDDFQHAAHTTRKYCGRPCYIQAMKDRQ